MRLAAVIAFAFVAISRPALGETTTFSTNDSWLTLGADDGTVKGCAVQTGVNGGKFTLGGSTDRQGTLTLSLFKSTWTIPNVPVPIVLTFADGNVTRLSGTGVGTRIAADFPEASVKSFIHQFTAEGSATLTLPEGREPPWHLDLHGTTPATLAMAQCIDATQLELPAPFRKPIPLIQTLSPDQPTPAAASPEQTQSPAPAPAPPDPAPSRGVVSPDVSNATTASSTGRSSADAVSEAAPIDSARTDTPHAYVAPQQSDSTGLDQRAPADNEAGTSHPFLIMFGLAIAGGIVWKVVALRAAADKIAQTLEAVRDEVEFNARALYVKRRQTVQTDEYGTVQYRKWVEAKDYYTSTRIAPIVSASGFAEWPEGFGLQIDEMIEEAATRPLQDRSDIRGEYASSPDFYDRRMHPIDYEGFCAMQLKKAGWDTRTTVASGDQGADVIGKQAGKSLVVQCKLYSSSVGNDAVQQVMAAKTFQSAQIAAVVSNQPYTRSAKQLASISGVYLLHHEELTSFRPPEVTRAVRPGK